jgi:glycosyltransferase involved in cell wall biosynthesis
VSSTPFLTTVHDVHFLDQPEWTPRVTRAYKSAMLKTALAKNPAAIICDSRHTRDRLLHHLPRTSADRTRVIYPGIEPVPVSWAGGGEASYFLTVGTIEPRKNHLGLLAGFRLARRQGAGVRWIVVGGPGQLSERIIAGLEAEPGVTLTGVVDDAELDGLYRQALFVATPSHIEGFGYPPLEAMVRGVPTITARASSLPEVVADSGPLIDPDDVAGWADAIGWLSRDHGARRELSRRGQRRAAEFSWTRTASEVAACYREVLHWQ